MRKWQKGHSGFAAFVLLTGETTWCGALDRNVTVSWGESHTCDVHPVGLLWAVSLKQMQKHESGQHIQHWENRAERRQILILFTCQLTQTCVKLPLQTTCTYFMPKMPPDMSNLRGWGWEEKQRRRECCLRVLIVCSLSVFYVTTTHCLSSTYGWVQGMCFLSLFLMTRVTSLTLHMLGRDGPTSQAQSTWRMDTVFSVVGW